ncbi:Arc family DNA binding domain-containing protein [Lysobacter arvi]|uniref:Arc family DNA binding domain-containing protein n=1 Tax=Lysobacter arvi TaxID=3038776 RepID=A0ABU1CIG4_9GAMM|nr:Arc family DNA binding domain-containing protein [Lysobacter arvi]MDR0184718.1 Arc family DNA binding domain-containing protein [Lysobacter arvi]
MSEKKAFPLRINADVLSAAQRWADDELRSLNAQIEYVLRDALRKAGRLPGHTSPSAPDPVSDEEST